jgi:hypothetical protein
MTPLTLTEGHTTVLTRESSNGWRGDDDTEKKGDRYVERLEGYG